MAAKRTKRAGVFFGAIAEGTAGRNAEAWPGSDGQATKEKVHPKVLWIGVQRS